MDTFLTNMASTAFFEKAKELIQDQRNSGAAGSEKHRVVVDGLLQFLEDVDDLTANVPYVGDLLAAAVNSQAAQEAKRNAVTLAVEFVYQTLKLDGQA